MRSSSTGCYANPVDPDAIEAMEFALDSDPLANQVGIDLIAIQHPKLACVGHQPKPRVPCVSIR